ncbi:glutathione S-transferase domain protein [Cyanobium sp. PCC 7001]|uniref:DUF952 domain-containing protein n=1 Tax=Cyanobium sp. PCC 7001 TaxID=180281 RepID=UPI000180504B|nr:DUF952 domain-containing protein [Cyanobium sp. PCC 7001]EDY39583.1 glutathione S-transferase domain protein [Cyanobium sp. PCC 7001]
MTAQLQLYSFRRCPYAIRARLALAAAGLRPGRGLELREVSLGSKPPELLEASPKGTVPVLVEPSGAVLEESLAIMRWALARRDPHGWLASGGDAAAAEQEALIAENDGPFKHHLDRTKYASRFGAEGDARRTEHRQEALRILSGWNRRLQGGGWLLGPRPSLADWALLPFVRQFRLADPEGFDARSDLAVLQAWLARFLQGPELAAVMASPWAERRPWRSPRWLYHLALEPEWRQAHQAGMYARSTRGLALEEVGFIHASYAHQVEATAERFFRDAGPLVLLTLDPRRLEEAGVPVRAEPAPGGSELFPHLYGPLPLEAVLRADPWRREPLQP